MSHHLKLVCTRSDDRLREVEPMSCPVAVRRGTDEPAHLWPLTMDGVCDQLFELGTRT